MPSPVKGLRADVFGFLVMWSPLLRICSSAAECRILECFIPELCERRMHKIVVTEGRGRGVCVGERATITSSADM